MQSDRDFVLGIVLIGLIGFSAGIIGDTAIKKFRHRHDGVPEIATVTIFNPKTGKEVLYRVAEFVEMGDNYTQFKTTDGKLVEILKNEVTEQ